MDICLLKFVIALTIICSQGVVSREEDKDDEYLYKEICYEEESSEDDQTQDVNDDGYTVIPPTDFQQNPEKRTKCIVKKVPKCKTSKYGCCADEITAASGFNKLGCPKHIVKSNVTTEESPMVCESSVYGCCQDGRTPAHGPDYEGCCLLSEFGCCPDNFTPADGPDPEDCDCSYTRFGCCLDWSTVARGPNEEGCGCQFSWNECCPDRITPASGLNFEGCGCHTYQFGCCPDGVTPATGADLLGCSCNESKYGCCGDEVTAAKGPNKEGCDCSNSKYGCMLDGVTEAKQKTLRNRAKPKRLTQCALPLERGPCAGKNIRWGFVPSTRRCAPFIWGGCQGNANRFDTEAACMHRCHPPNTLPAKCAREQDGGNCTDKHPMWWFSQTENTCKPFYYSGCGGNENRFATKQDCMDVCPSVSGYCKMPTKINHNCSEIALRGSFTVNNTGAMIKTHVHKDQNQCEVICMTELPLEEDMIVATSYMELPLVMACEDHIDAGPCTRAETRWAYNSTSDSCVQFQYGGCGGNKNNFISQDTCQRTCSSGEDICELTPVPGHCTIDQRRWFYEQSSDSCKQFADNMCGENGNSFKNLVDCQRRCRIGFDIMNLSVAVRPKPQIKPFISIICDVMGKVEECQRASMVWYFDKEQDGCVSYENSETGNTCMVTGVFATEELCERACGAFQDIDVCSFEKDPGPCHDFSQKVYYNKATDRCENFTYGGCRGSPNRFSTMSECEYYCRPEYDPCQQRPDIGECRNTEPKWYFDELERKCLMFLYTGCGGNSNRFNTKSECETRCINGERFFGSDFNEQ
ncbi:unnamed protein product [Leptosia nina]|uniref:BPTI/Kunitz inhibitor domain-containing protein n=1 Tax=Leptosia nina TaxID=320188 RepID=A0AAV1JR31_9NEOP